MGKWVLICFFPSFLLPFIQPFIEHLLCVRHWARLWQSTKSKTAQVPALVPYSSCFGGEVSRVWSQCLLGEVGQGEGCGETK